MQMTRTQAEKFMKALDHQLKRETETIAAIKRKRSWRESERAMAQLPYIERHKAITELREIIGTEFNLGGY